jgi:dihydroorotase
MKVLLKDVNLFSPDQNIDEKSTSVLLEDGIMSEIGDIKTNDANVYELGGKYVVPGFFDMHVHLREPGREDEETVITGSNAAANGGFTGIACMPNTKPAIDSAEVVNFIKEQANNQLVDVYPVGAATVGREGEVLSPIAELAEAGAVGLSDEKG